MSGLADRRNSTRQLSPLKTSHVPGDDGETEGLTRETAPNTPTSDMGSPMASPQNPTFAKGETIHSAAFMSFKDESILSLADYVNHQNQKLIMGRLDDTNKILGKAFES